jgi:hypothetical protein
VGPTPVAAIAEDDDLPPAAAIAEDDFGYDDDRAPRRGDGGFSIWFRVKLGLLLVFIGTLVIAGAFALELIAYLLWSVELISQLTARGPRQGGGSDAFLTLLRIESLFAVAGSISMIVGYVFAMLGPNKRGTMPLAIATLAVTAVETLLTLIFKVPWLFRNPLEMFMGYGFGTWFPQVLVQLLFAAEFIVFPLYLRSLSYILKSSKNAKQCLWFMVLSCFYAGERLVTFIMFYVITQQRSDSRALGWIALILLWLGAFIFLAMIIWYPILLWRTRKLVK